MTNTPDILLSALRQHQHNDCSGLITAFDYEETIKIISALENLVRAVHCGDISGLSLDDVDGKNWFDMRRKVIGESRSYGNATGDRS